MKPKVIKLKHGEWIFAVVPVVRFGPGWANKPVYVYIDNGSGVVRTECLQPSEQSIELLKLFEIGRVVVDSLIGAVPVKKAKS